jgi:hypothetical protein
MNFEILIKNKKKKKKVFGGHARQPAPPPINGRVSILNTHT